MVRAATVILSWEHLPIPPSYGSIVIVRCLDTCITSASSALGINCFLLHFSQRQREEGPPGIWVVGFAHFISHGSPPEKLHLFANLNWISSRLFQFLDCLLGRTIQSDAFRKMLPGCSFPFRALSFAALRLPNIMLFLRCGTSFPSPGGAAAAAIRHLGGHGRSVGIST